MKLLEGLSKKRSQIQKDKCCMIPFIQGTQKSQIHCDRKQNGGCQGLEERGNGGGYYSMGTEFQFGKMKSSRDRQ